KNGVVSSVRRAASIFPRHPSACLCILLSLKRWTSLDLRSKRRNPSSRPPWNRRSLVFARTGRRRGMSDHPYPCQKVHSVHLLFSGLRPLGPSALAECKFTSVTVASFHISFCRS